MCGSGMHCLCYKRYITDTSALNTTKVLNSLHMFGFRSIWYECFLHRNWSLLSWHLDYLPTCIDRMCSYHQCALNIPPLCIFQCEFSISQLTSIDYIVTKNVKGLKVIMLKNVLANLFWNRNISRFQEGLLKPKISETYRKFGKLSKIYRLSV